MEEPKIIMEVVSEIHQLEYQGDIKAIACVLILADGHARTLFAYREGQHFPIIAGVSILSHELLNEVEKQDSAQKEPEPHD